MKKLFFIIMFSLFLINNSYPDSHLEEIIDCTQFEKLKDKLDCKAKNLRTTLNKGQSKVKEKIENPGETEAGKKFKNSKLGKALKKFKDAKTGADLMNSE
tara:strand:+ start:369 stop:668 length:300 start_codon:yes stop_codon:yes gene_type:complete